jgi:aryl-alcohol dehydrogenase-like predicted oxidoreductase
MALGRVERLLVRVEVVDELDDVGLAGVFDGNLHPADVTQRPRKARLAKGFNAPANNAATARRSARRFIVRRSSTLEYRHLGKSGLKVPVLSFGTGTFGGKGEFFSAWGSTDVAEARKLIDICIDAGVNMFDSADIYSDGAAESVLGEAIKGRPRDKLIISTKATFRSGPGANEVGSSRHHLVQAVDSALKRLGTDYIDLFQLHGFDASTPVEETVSTLDDLVRAGKLRYVGASNFSGWHLMKSLAVSERYGYARYVAHQAYYSLVGREYEWELMPLAQDQGVGAVVWSPLGWGRLTGKIRRGQPLPANSRLHVTADMGPPVADELLYRVVDALEKVARRNRQDRAAGRAQLAPATADGVQRGRRCARRNATATEPRRGRLESHTGAGRRTRCGQRGDADLSVLAPAGFSGAQPEPGLSRCQTKHPLLEVLQRPGGRTAFGVREVVALRHVEVPVHRDHQLAGAQFVFDEDARREADAHAGRRRRNHHREELVARSARGMHRVVPALLRIPVAPCMRARAQVHMAATLEARFVPRAVGIAKRGAADRHHLAL